MSKAPKPTRDPYPSDLKDGQWKMLASLLEEEGRAYAEGGSASGRPATSDLRAITEGVLYQARTGIPWNYLPRDIYPAWQTVYDYAKAWERSGVMAKVFAVLNLLPPSPDGSKPARTRRGKASGN